MARSPRITNPEEPTVYHLISRTTLPGFPIGEAEKDFFVELVRKYSQVYFTEILGFCCMGNHFHLLVRMLPAHAYTDEEVGRRHKYCYGPFRKLMAGQIPHHRDRWSDISEFMKEIKVRFTRYYNRLHDHKGYFWGDRFKSVLVENGDALLNCLAYIDLNPVRAGLVKRPEDYRWSSLGWHIQTGNMGGLLSTDFGLVDDGLATPKERLTQYRQFVYEIGGMERANSGRIDQKIVAEEREKNFEMTRFDRFRYRTRYFTDSGIIGSKKYVTQIYNAVKYRLPTKRQRVPQRIDGLEGIYSLKRFVEKKPQQNT